MSNNSTSITTGAGGRQVKVVIKEIYKHTAACIACRTRKRKCDGKAPCSYCVAKQQPCEFTQQRKRGPARKNEENRYNPTAAPSLPAMPTITEFSLHTNNLEIDMFDKYEAKVLIEHSWSYIKHRMAVSSDRILSPQTTADKIQAYATLAFAARITGAAPKASTFISSARSLAGSIFDSPQPDAVSALMMMSHYWQLVLDIPLARFYSDIAYALSRITKLDGKLAILCKVGGVFTSSNYTPQEQSMKIKDELKKVQRQAIGFDCPFVDAAAEILQVFGFNILFPNESSIHNFLHIVDDLVVSEEQRMQIVEILNYVRVKSSLQAGTVGDILFFEMFCSLYQAITEWKSGHISEALAYGRACLNGTQQLAKNNQFGLASDFPHICMMGSLCKLFHEQGEYDAVMEMCQFIKGVCRIMQPEYNFVVIIIDQFLNNMNYDISNARPSPQNLSQHHPPSFSPPSLSPSQGFSSPSSPESPVPETISTVPVSFDGFIPIPDSFASPSAYALPSFSTSTPSPPISPSTPNYIPASTPNTSMFTAPLPTPTPAPTSASLSFIDNSNKYSTIVSSFSNRSKLLQTTTLTHQVDQVPVFFVDNANNNLNGNNNFNPNFNMNNLSNINNINFDSLLNSTGDNFEFPLVNL